jgi:hypothetical protein
MMLIARRSAHAHVGRLGDGALSLCLSLCVSVALAAGCDRGDSLARSRGQALANPSLAAPDYDVSAPQLYAEILSSMDRGSREAEQRYQGHVVRVSGDVKRQAEPASNGRQLHLAGSAATGRVFCDLAPEAGDFTPAPGQHVVLQCRFDAWTVGPHLVACTPVPTLATIIP